MAPSIPSTSSRVLEVQATGKYNVSIPNGTLVVLSPIFERISTGQNSRVFIASIGYNPLILFQKCFQTLIVNMYVLVCKERVRTLNPRVSAVYSSYLELIRQAGAIQLVGETSRL